MRLKLNVLGAALLSVLFIAAGATQQPAPTADADWPMYRHDLAGTGYSRLAQIDASNVANLSQSWSLGLQSDAPPPAAAGGRGGAGGALNSEATPIVVAGVMYVPAANRVLALDSETGKEIWSYRLTGGAPSRRGVAYWPGQGADRRASSSHPAVA